MSESAGRKFTYKYITRILRATFVAYALGTAFALHVSTIEGLSAVWENPRGQSDIIVDDEDGTNVDLPCHFELHARHSFEESLVEHNASPAT